MSYKQIIHSHEFTYVGVCGAYMCFCVCDLVFISNFMKTNAFSEKAIRRKLNLVCGLGVINVFRKLKAPAIRFKISNKKSANRMMILVTMIFDSLFLELDKHFVKSRLVKIIY